MSPKKASFACKPTHVTNEEDVKARAKHIEGIDGKLDVLVNNAGYAGPRDQSGSHDKDFTAKKTAAEDPFEPETVPNWTDLFTLNTITPFFVVRAFQSLLVKGASSRPQGTSSLINITSVAAKTDYLLKVQRRVSSRQAQIQKMIILEVFLDELRDKPGPIEECTPGIHRIEC
ncbi:hypothetical protein IW261DRAFT_1415539 [Armillaria novae-zelandiae]|uniref:NAD(P)-binding protein n=1 Tax=Armillaria novae-zelandiae TaxID=153914 RepID=A0AA39PP53_9AGAR|nr:hypothetical protein IW261DRAFT_1415539 [Armillaria novae-zelandiae]